jgi:predicted metalloendopeptidase
LVENVKRAFRERLEGLDWMSDETKAEARAKLEAFRAKIAYPDVWEEYEGLEVVPGDALGNAKRAAEWHHQDEVAKLGSPVDRDEWFMTPQTVNAYYSSLRNEIVFPAAILQPPFFDPNADPAINYGGIGAVIGHEIGHGFDDQGRKSDGQGLLRNWWTEEDLERFDARAQNLGRQYATYEPIPGIALNPELTMGENIGDLGGLSLAHHAYQIATEGEEQPVLDGFTGDQRFFLAWAQVWKRKYREAELRRRIVTDPHSPSEFRTNGIVRNMDAWYEAFDVEPDDDLYLAPEERVSIW